MQKLAERQRKLEYRDDEGKVIDGGWGLSDEDFDALTALISGRPRLPPTTYRLDAPVLVHDIRQAGRMPFTTSQLLRILGALDEWRKFSEELISSVDEAAKSVERLVSAMSSQRSNSIGVSGRMLWGILSLAVPPPIGPALGAIAYAAIEDTYTDGFQRLTEWTLQMPMLYDSNNRIVGPTYANRYGEGNANRLPLARNPGGQEKIKDIKDYNQMASGIDKLFGGDRRKFIDKWNEKTLKALWGKLPKVKANDSNDLKELFRQGCKQVKEVLINSVEDLLKDFLNNPTTATSIVFASANFQNDSLAVVPAEHVHDVVRSGCQLYMNTLVHELFSQLLERANNHRPPVFHSTQKAEFQIRIEKYLIAKYFRDNTAEPANRLVKANPGYPIPNVANGNLQRLDNYQANYYANTRGTVPEKMFAPTIFSQAAPSFMKNSIDGFFVSPLEKKLVELGILRKVANEAAVAAWVPGSDSVLYYTLDAAARGRIAEWASRYLAQDRVSDMQRLFMSPEQASQARRLPRADPFGRPLA